MTSERAAQSAPTIALRGPVPIEADILIVNGQVVDGTGAPWIQADVAITGDKIVHVGRAPVRAKRVIDAKGSVVSPGFIDMHSHSEFGLSLDGRGLSKITQGFTTDVMGEHLSAGPVLGPAVDDPMMVTSPVQRSWTTLGGFFSYLMDKGIGINVASYVGCGQVRASVMGYENTPVQPDDMARMKVLVAQAMEEGACGLAAGLGYAPNTFFNAAEMIELAKVAASYGGLFAIHIRNATGLAGMTEAVEIGRGANIPVHIFHFGASVLRDPDPYIQRLMDARSNGLDMTGDSYPYTSGWTYLKQSLPVWAQEGSATDIVDRLRLPDSRARVTAELKALNRDFSRVMVASINPEFDGKTVVQIAGELGLSPEETVVEVLVKQGAEGFTIKLPDETREPIITRVMEHPWISVGSDGIALPSDVRTAFGSPHPRSFGSSTRILSHYVRERGVFSLEEAVRKMTSLAATRLGLADRGILRAGMQADIVVFDPLTVKDMATFEQPARYSEGISWVLVNGVPVVADSEPTGALPGRVLRGPGYASPSTA